MHGYCGYSGGISKVTKICPDSSSLYSFASNTHTDLSCCEYYNKFKMYHSNSLPFLIVIVQSSLVMKYSKDFDIFVTNTCLCSCFCEITHLCTNVDVSCYIHLDIDRT